MTFVQPYSRVVESFGEPRGPGRRRVLRLRAPGTVDPLPYVEESDQADLDAGLRVLKPCDVLSKIFDGKPSRGLGGTGDLVARAVAEGKAHEVICLTAQLAADPASSPRPAVPHTHRRALPMPPLPPAGGIGLDPRERSRQVAVGARSRSMDAGWQDYPQDYPGEWVEVRAHGAEGSRPGVYEVPGHPDAAVVVYSEDDESVVVPRQCPHLEMDLVRVGMVNCTTRELTCYHRRHSWKLPTGDAERGAAMRVYPTRLEGGRLFAYLPVLTVVA